MYHIAGIRPRKIFAVKDFSVLIFEGEYGSIYEIDFSSQNMRFLDHYENNYSLVTDTITQAHEDLLEKNFCGRLLDCLFIEDRLVVCCTSDGSIHLLSYSEGDWDVVSELHLTQDRLLSLGVLGQTLYALSHSGCIYRLGLDELRSKGIVGSVSAIWDMSVSGDFLYCGCADGRCCIYNKNSLKISRTVPTKTGWINSISEGVCCTSGGVIYKISSDNDLSEICNAYGKFWFNGVRIIGQTILAITAEGYVLQLTSSGELKSQMQLSSSQLISIDAQGDRIYAASINGELIVCELSGERLQMIKKVQFDNMHLTCVCVEKGILVVSTTEGKVCTLSLQQLRDLPLDITILTLSKSRIWKILLHEGHIYGASADGELFKVSTSLRSIKKYNTHDAITTAAIMSQSLVIGTWTGSVYRCPSKGWTDITVARSASRITSLPLHGNKGFSNHTPPLICYHATRQIDFLGRLMNFFEQSKLVFRIVTHEDIEPSGSVEWWKYPYITFNGEFVASGMLFDEFMKQHVFERLVPIVVKRSGLQSL